MKALVRSRGFSKKAVGLFLRISVEEDSQIFILMENTGKTVIHINCRSIFLDQSPKVKEIEAKINK